MERVVPRDTPGPSEVPIGMVLARVGKAVDRAFDDALATVGGSRSTWLVLLAAKSSANANQTKIAGLLGISGPTLIHHLDRMVSAGLVVRTRDPADRRPNSIMLTAAGEKEFRRLRGAAVAFDARLRSGLTEAQLADLRAVLAAIGDNVGHEEGGPQ